MTRPQVVLIGAPGAGKTTVGRLLATQLNTGFRDTDQDVETTAGMPVSDIFIDHGEDRFRELERAAVLLALTEHDGVLSVGGGAVLDPQTRTALAGHRVAYLVVSPPAAAKRVGLARDRPLLVGAPRQQLGALLKARAPLYTEVATMLIETDDRSPDDVAAAILAALADQDPS
jgi:shikimate kinase